MICNNLDKMGRKRLHNKNLPKRLREKKGWYYYVIHTDGKTNWYPLKTQEIGKALERWGQVEKQLAEENFNVDKIEQKSATRILLKDLITRYFQESTGRLSLNTIRNYKRMAENIAAYFVDVSVHKITRQEIIRYHDSMRDKPYEANRRVVFMRTLLQKALDWGYVENNVADGIKKYKEYKCQLKLTTEILFDEIHKAAEPMMQRAIMLAFHLVQHENEIKNLKWKHIDINRKTVRFTRQKTKEEIAIDYSGNETLVNYIDELYKNRKELCPYMIFHQSKTGWQGYKSFRSMWYRALKQAGYEKTSYQFKEIRHLANTCMKDAGITADMRKAVTGHKSVATNEIYTHKSGQDTVKALQSLSKYKPSD